jgi:hypothetical protein
MESSPLKYLDNDVSQMLCKQVRLAREEEARRFHDDLFHYGEKANKDPHEIIAKCLNKMTRPDGRRVLPGYFHGGWNRTLINQTLYRWKMVRE